MSSSADSFITEIKLDSRPLEVALGALKIKFGEAATQISNSFSVAKASLDTLLGATAGLRQYLAESVQAATDAEQAEVKLATALQLHHAYNAQVVTGLQEYNSALQQKTGIDDDNLTKVQATLAAMGVYNVDLKLATAAVIGLSERTGNDLQASTMAVGKAILGNSVALRRMGVEGDDTSAIIRELAKSEELAEARAATFGGQLQVLHANTGDLSESVGAYITQNHAAIQSVTGLSAVTRATAGSLQTLRPAWNAVTEASASGVHSMALGLPVLGGLVGAWDAMTMGAEQYVREMDRAAAAQKAVTEGDIETPARKGAGQGASRGSLDRDLAEGAAFERQQEAERQRAAAAQAQAVRGEEELQKKLDETYKRGQEKAEASAQEAFHRQTERDLKNLSEWRKQDHERLRTQTDAVNEANAANIDVWRNRFRSNEEHFEAEKAYWTGIGSLVESGTSQVIGGTLIAAEKAALAGQDVAGAVGSMLGGLLVQTGEGLVGLGSAAIAAQALSAIPFFAGLVGPPGASAAAGAAAMGAGLALIAVGTGLGAATGGGGTAGGGAGGGGGPATGYSPEEHGFSGWGAVNARQRTSDQANQRRRDRAQERASSMPADEGGPTQTVYNLHFGGRPLVTELEVGRAVERAQVRANRARGKPSWGGRRTS